MVQHLCTILLEDGPARKAKTKQVSRDLHFLASGVIEVLNAIARTNLSLFQSFFGSNSWDQVEFYHVLNFLLAQLGGDSSVSDTDSSSDGGGGTSSSLSNRDRDTKVDVSKADLRDSIITLIGYFVQNNPKNQVRDFSSLPSL